MTRMVFAVPGHPRTKKTSQRVIQVKGRIRVIPSKVTLEWSNDAQLRLQAQMGRYRGVTFHDGQQWNLRAVFYRKQETTADLVGHVQALCDVLQAAGVVGNDRQIRGLDGCRMEVDERNPRVELALEEMQEPRPDNRKD